jgi:hypothetical protein
MYEGDSAKCVEIMNIDFVVSIIVCIIGLRWDTI